MNLVKWEGSKIVIAPEAMAIKAFRKLWERDLSKDKDKALLELSTIYFLYDPRSEYQYETDLDERLRIISEQTGIPSDWEPDENFENAVEVYKYLTKTTSASILEGNRLAVASIREVIETPIEDLELSALDKLAYADKLSTTLSRVNKLAEEIAKAEKEIYKEVDEHSAKMRGQYKRSIGDQGLENIF